MKPTQRFGLPSPRTVGEIALHALPVRLDRDVLYLWATFRLRYRPVKMALLLATLGALCWLWQWAGGEWGAPWLSRRVAMLQPGRVQTVLGRTATAVFSSLNFLSCVTIAILARSIRSLIKEGHIESILMTPRRIRPSALYYALATRYLPLAFVAVLVIYLDPAQTPFARMPFVAPAFGAPPAVPVVEPDHPLHQRLWSDYRRHRDAFDRMDAQYDRQLADPWTVRWPLVHELSILLFCPANLFMDLAISFWIFMRMRLTMPTTVAAIVVVGVVSPVLLMSIHEWILTQFAGAPVFQGLRSAQSVQHHRLIANSMHYFSTSILSVVAGWALLADLDARWLRRVRSATLDPVFIRQLD